jgi:hypothetical protein
VFKLLAYQLTDGLQELGRLLPEQFPRARARVMVAIIPYLSCSTFSLLSLFNSCFTHFSGVQSSGQKVGFDS